MTQGSPVKHILLFALPTLIGNVFQQIYNLADSMIANFYHPLSTLLMETAAFGGYDLVMEAYDKALKNGYMFGCYGDAMLIVND